MDYFMILPTDITLDILTRLPAEDVLESKSVCTSWNNLVSHHPSFCRMHFHRHSGSTGDDSGKRGSLTSTNDDTFYYLESYENNELTTIRRMNFTPPLKSFKFIGSCKGLICLVQGRSVCVCNPFTREYVILPEFIVEKGSFWMTEFCYVSSTNEYKVLRKYSRLKPREPWKVNIYTLGSGSGWRKLEEEFNYSYGFTHVRCTTFANEALYWMDDELQMIGTFDFVEEKFREHLSPPPLPPNTNWSASHIGVLDGFLYFASNIHVKDDKRHDLWLLKSKNDDHGIKGRNEHQSLGWSKEVKIDKSRLLAVAKSYGAFNLHWYHLNCYDTKASKRLVELKGRNYLVIPHKNSLVSLKELGEQDTKRMESLEGGREP